MSHSWDIKLYKAYLATNVDRDTKPYQSGRKTLQKHTRTESKLQKNKNHDIKSENLLIMA